MRLGKTTYWLPLTRLAAFFAAVVMAGNVFFHAFRSAAASIPQGPEASVDLFTRKKKRLERRFFQVLGRFLVAPASASSPPEIKTADAVPRPILIEPAALEPMGIVSAGPSVERLGFLEPEAPPFAWPAPLALRGGAEFGLPKTLATSETRDSRTQLLEEQSFRAQLVTDLYRRCGHDPLADAGDALLRGPEMLFDELSGCLGSSGRSPVRTSQDEESRSVTGRMLDVQLARRDQRIFTLFLEQWTEREQRYLGAFEDESRANTYGFQNRSEGVDLDELANDQRKIVWDALRRTYLARYKMQSQHEIPEEAWFFGSWSGVDIAVLPPLLAGYLYYRGLNKRISMGETALRISFEPLSDIVRRKHDRSVAAALEWTIKGFPVGVILSAGLHDGAYGMDFVGIGTSIGAARSLVELQYADGRR